MAISRQQASTPKKKVDRYSASTSQIDSSLASPSAKKERGRPLASPSSGPRTPTTRKRVSRDTIAKTKRAEEISVLRRGIAMERHHPELKDDEETEIAEGVVEPENILPKKLDFGEIKVEEIETTSRTEEKPHGEMSKSTYFRKLQKVSEVFQQVAVDWKEMADVGLNLLARSDNIINKDKMEITVSESDYRQHLKERFSSGQNKTITRKANYVRDALVECEEKEIILEDLLLKTVLDSSYCYIVMEKAGMVISDNLKPRYAVLDFGTNYCNLKNLADGAGLSAENGFLETDIGWNLYSILKC